MKKKITFKGILQASFVIALLTVIVTVFFGLPLWGSTVLFVALGCLAFTDKPQNVLFTGLYPDVYTREIIKRFDSADKATWRNGIPDKSQYNTMTADGETVVINLSFFGATPDILIDNNTYPLDIQALDGENITMSLKKYQSKVVPVTDDEVRGLVYDKIKVVQESFAVAIEEKKNAMAIHSIAPLNNTYAAAPVLVTTGADCGDGTGRLKLLIADILRLKKAWDDAKIPLVGRRLVLCSDHVNDLLGQNQSFDQQFYNYTTGKIANMFGFEIYEYVDMPYYHIVNKTKLSFGGAVTSAYNKASVAFHLQRVGQSKGFTKAYLSESKTDPTMQRNLLAYRHYDVVIPIKNEGQAAIVSGKAA